MVQYGRFLGEQMINLKRGFDMNIKLLHEKLEHLEDNELKEMILELLNERERLLTECERDELTGTYNRRILNSITRYGAIAMCDLDNLKAINDTFGHEEGDRVLKVFAHKLQSCVRSNDIVCRYGGDEFVMFFVSCPVELVESRLNRALVDLQAQGINFSAGISSYTIGKTLEDALKEADEALYKSKESGKNRVTIHKEKALVLKKE